MRKVLFATAAVGLFLFSASGFASEELFKKNNCLACHAVDTKRFGPSLKEVSAKYKGDSTAVEKLAKKIQTGGSGVWGQLPMPPQPQVSDADARILAQYSLSQN